MTARVRTGQIGDASVSVMAWARRSATLFLVSAIAAACAGPAKGPTATAPTMPTRGTLTPAPPTRSGPADAVVLPATLDDAAAVHLLSRATFGIRPGDVGRLRSVGAAAWLDEQLSLARLDEPEVDAALAQLRTLTMPIPTLLRDFPRPDPTIREKVRNGEVSRRELMETYPPEKRPARIVGELATARMIRAVLSEHQLEEMMVDFWFNHFNVYALKGEVRWYVTAYERDVIRPHALGQFRDLVRASSRHPRCFTTSTTG